jgi:hypothetical protein
LREATPLVIAISGPSGAGKTTVAKAVAERLDAASLFFDDWTDDPPDVGEWIGEPDADSTASGRAPGQNPRRSGATAWKPMAAMAGIWWCHSQLLRGRPCRRSSKGPCLGPSARAVKVTPRASISISFNVAHLS